MKNILTLRMDGDAPVVAVALHNGHFLSEDLLRVSALDDAVRLREEDPFTGLWTTLSDNRVVVHYSRFAFDLNRSFEKAVYMVPSDAWGLDLWKVQPPETLLEESRQMYTTVYRMIRKGFTGLLKRFGSLAVFDLHSYNHRREGPDAPPENPVQNPEINLGTGNIDRAYWAPLVDRFIGDLQRFDFHGRRLDIRENIKFAGGYFSRWIHENFAKSVCCLSIEVKKFFMDEWTGEPDHGMINSLGDVFRFTVPGVLEELSRYSSKK